MDALHQTHRWLWQPYAGPLMAKCGDKPKLLAIGIAPQGIISIGIVPMGVVSIGVVPMGVLSLGAVGMGVINICVVGMGIVVAGVNVMGIWNAGASSPHQHHQAATRTHSPNLYAYPSKQEALIKAKQLGCNGVHAMGSLWMPCATHPELEPPPAAQSRRP